MKKNIAIEGMTCGHCVMHVTGALEKVPGVTRVKVYLNKKLAEVEGSALDDAELRKAVVDAGYEPISVST